MNAQQTANRVLPIVLLQGRRSVSSGAGSPAATAARGRHTAPVGIATEGRRAEGPPAEEAGGTGAATTPTRGTAATTAREAGGSRSLERV